MANITINEFVTNLILQTERETGVSIKMEDKIQILALAKIVNSNINDYQGKLGAEIKSHTETAKKLILATQNLNSNLSNLSNPIRFSNATEAAAFNSKSALINLTSVIVLCSTVLILAFGYLGSNAYFNQKQMTKFKIENPTIYRHYFKQY